MSLQIEEWCNKNELTIAGQLPFDRIITEAMVDAKSITEFSPEHEISNKIKIIWKKILNQKK
jgi:MinD superfamily P-loop ATPase